jgi:hypothetical protein
LSDEEVDKLVQDALARNQELERPMPDAEVEKTVRRFAALRDIGLPAIEFYAEQQRRKHQVFDLIFRHAAPGRTIHEMYAEMTEAEIAELDDLLAGQTVADVLEWK